MLSTSSPLEQKSFSRCVSVHYINPGIFLSAHPVGSSRDLAPHNVKTKMLRDDHATESKLSSGEEKNNKKRRNYGPLAVAVVTFCTSVLRNS
ncbi:uncharacterized [Tachysurus ichikawai]